MAHDYLLRFDARLEMYSGPSSARAILALGFLLILVFYGLTGYLLDVSRFSPDSWSYYELAGTVFEGEFYSFNTWRSYFTETHSASFPLGYPVAVALVQQIVGSSPLAAVWLNIFLAALTWVIGILVAMRLGVPAFAALVLSTALVLWPPYLEEVFAGRSIPLAVIWTMLALAAHQGNRPWLGGVLLGMAVLTRFDYLVIALLFIAGMALLDNENRRQLGWWLFGLLLGMLPWVTYSWLHFERFWISDNSWVALSAASAYVTDFPARASVTIFDSPDIWLARVFGNVRPLYWSLKEAVLSFSPLIALLPVTVWAVLRAQRAQLIRFGLALLIIGASLTPYLLTGYFSQRYFATFLMACSLALALLCITPARPLMNGFLAFALISSLITGGLYLARASWWSYSKIQEGIFDQDAAFLRALHECHLKLPERTLIFPAPHTLAARYGATTGMKTAFLPNNWERMSAMKKKAYFAYLEPFLIIDDSFQPSECLSYDQQ